MVPSVLQIHEQVLAAADAYDVAPGAARQRQLQAALQAAGFALSGAYPLDDDAWAASDAHVLLMYASDYDDRYSCWMIPATAIDAAADADLTALHRRAVVHGETCIHAPAQWEAWVRICLRTALKTNDEFEADVELRADNDLPGAPELPDRDLDCWTHHSASAAGELDGHKFIVRIARVVLLRENT